MKKKIVIELEKTEGGWSGKMRGKTDNSFTDPVKTTGTLSTLQGAIVNISMKTKIVEQWMEQIS